MLLCSLAVILFYRGKIIFDYAARFVDEDQALIWCGTASAAHFQFSLEPHFWGQAYGSMAESLAALPFYLAGFPLCISCPMGTVLLWLLPFLLASLWLFRQKKYAASIAALCLSLLFGWKYDFLTTIPRSFLPGFAPALLGILLLLSVKNHRFDSLRCLIAPILFAVGFIWTETAVTIELLAVLYLLLFRSADYREHWKALLAGSTAAVLLTLFCDKIFYLIHPDYIVFESSHFQIAFDNFLKNFANIPSLFRFYSCVSFGSLPLILFAVLAGLVLYALLTHRFRLLLVDAAAVAGTMAFFFVGKTLQFSDEFFFTQARMFLFIPCILLFLLLAAADSGETELSPVVSLAVMAGAAALLLLVGGWKYTNFWNVMQDPSLYESANVTVREVSALNQMSEEISALARENDASIVICSNNNTAAYATAAMNQSVYLGFNMPEERRPYLYLPLMEQPMTGNVLFITADNITSDHVSAWECCHLEGQSLGNLLAEKGMAFSKCAFVL